MLYALDRFDQEVRSAIVATGTVRAEMVELVSPNPNVHADRTFPVFRAAKESGRAPAQLANDLAAALRFAPASLVGEYSASGPYLNFVLNPAPFVTEVLGEVERLGSRYGHDDLGADRTVVVDYSSPNVAKRMHVGHIRSTIIGQALVHIFAALGYRAIGDNHLGDWGKSFGVLIAAIEHEGEPAGEGKELLAALEQLYARYSALAEFDPVIDQEARSWSLKLEQGDAAARAVQQRMVALTERANQPSYDRLGARFDHAFGESYYEPMLPGVIAEALARGVAQRNEDGAVVVALADDLPSFLLQRSDGGTLYHTRDLATLIFRLREFAPVQIVYVIGEPQSLYLRQLFALVRALGYGRDTKLVHVPFGTVFDANGQPLSTRRGNMVYLEALLDEAHARARAIVDRASPQLPEPERAAIAEAVGVGAVIYNDLSQNPRRNITLDWDRMLSLDGNSAPYIQYMHARCRSILRNAAIANTQASDDRVGMPTNSLLPVHPSEITLAKNVARLPAAVRRVGAEYAPSEVATWGYETARALAAFYRDCPVLQADSPELRTARLRLVAATAQSLKNGLALLGIKAPERM